MNEGVEEAGEDTEEEEKGEAVAGAEEVAAEHRWRREAEAMAMARSRAQGRTEEVMRGGGTRRAQ